MYPKFVYVDLLNYEYALYVFRNISGINQIVKSAFRIISAYQLSGMVSVIDIIATKSMVDRMIFFDLNH
jgi:hypothetical protein